MGAAMFTQLSVQMALLATGGGDALRADPARLAAQIIPGIGFIGAGAILHGRGRVTGLTTAATLWVVTAIGIAVGAGAYVEAIGTTIMVLITLLLLSKVEALMGHHRSHRRYTAAVDPSGEAFERLIDRLKGERLVVKVETVEKNGSHLEVAFRVTGPRDQHDQLVKALIDDQAVCRFTPGHRRCESLRGIAAPNIWIPVNPSN